MRELDRLTDAFVLLAPHVEPGDLPHALGQLLDALLPNELERRAQDAHEQRGFRMRLKDDGSGWLVTRGDLDLECGELLQTVLTAELAVDADNPRDTAAYAAGRQDGWQPGDDLPPQAAADPARSTSAATTPCATACGAPSTAASPACATRSPRTWPSPSRRRPARRSPAPCLRSPPVRRPPAPQPRPRAGGATARVTRFVLSLGRKVPRDQPHRTHPQTARTTRQADRDRRPLPRRRLPTGPGDDSSPTTPTPGPAAAPPA